MRSRAKARAPASQRLPENMVTAIVSTVHSNAGGGGGMQRCYP
jgi:hypothetical protein